MIETTNQNRFYRTLPSEIRDLLQISNGWLVGSSIESILRKEPVTDFDIIVTSENYNASFAYLRQYIIGFNSFGGLKAKINDIDIDLWVQDLDSFIQIANKIKYAYNFKSNKFLTLT